MEKPFPAYRGEQPYAFVCYAHADAALVYPEIGWLHGDGVRLWYDEGIPGGRVWSRETASRIRGAAAVLYYVSTSSIASDHCNREIHYAFNLSVPVVPVYLEPVELPDDLALNLSHVQALRSSAAGHRQRLREALAPAEGEATPLHVHQQITAVRPRIAIFPFENLVESAEFGWLGRRLAQKTMQLVHESGQLEVVPERDVRRFVGSDATVAELGAAMSADYLLEGSVLIAGARFTLDVTLTDTHTSRQLWTRTFDREIARVLEVQRDLLGQLAGALEVASGLGNAVRGTQDSGAYLAFLEHPVPRADDVDACFKVIDAMKRALQHDPGYGNAYVSLAASYNFLALALGTEDYMKLANDCFEKSLEVGGISRFNAAWSTWCVATPAIGRAFDWPRAEAALAEAMTATDEYVRWLTDPIEEQHAPLERGYAGILRAAGLFTEAAAFADLEMERVRAFHPGGWDPQGIAQMGVPVHYADAGELEKCRSVIEEDMVRRPDVAENLLRRAQLYHIPAGHLGEARRDIDAYLSRPDLIRGHLGKGRSDNDVERIMRKRCAVAEILLAIAGRDEPRARRLIDETGHREYLGRLGDMDGMVAYLEQALGGGKEGLLWDTRALLLGAPDPEGQARHASYRALLEQINLTDSWQRELSDRVDALAPITGVRASTCR